jgi:hypothetical protein
LIFAIRPNQAIKPLLIIKHSEKVTLLYSMSIENFFENFAKKDNKLPNDFVNISEDELFGSMKKEVSISTKPYYNYGLAIAQLKLLRKKVLFYFIFF